MTDNEGKNSNPEVVMKTSLGEIRIELYEDKSPETVKNFLHYNDDRFFDGTIFHRVIDGFMIQGGGLTPELTEKPGYPPIKNEADNGVKNLRGTIAMARTQDIHSATSQFFINVKDNSFLDHSPRGFGYCVFGKVTQGMDVVDRIKTVPTRSQGRYDDVPAEPVVILSVARV
jgi:cyclophilin family peptidyl-prolyl cis-trans isomerase